jgi:hypothetical protein
MVSRSLVFAFAFPREIRGMQMPNATWRTAGRQGARGAGISHPKLSEANEGAASSRDFCEAKIMGKPLAARQDAVLRKVWFPYSCASAHRTFRVGVAGRNRPAPKEKAEDAKRLEMNRNPFA